MGKVGRIAVFPGIPTDGSVATEWAFLAGDQGV